MTVPNWLEQAARESLTVDPEKCVGFADCGCSRCRRTRRNATQAHPLGKRQAVSAAHDPAYCAHCTAARRAAVR